MDGLWQDLRHALRRILRTPGFSAVVVVVTALGIGANSAVFSVVNGVLLRPLPFTQPERLAMVWQTFPKQGWGQVPFSRADFHDLAMSTRRFERVAGVFLDRSQRTLTGGEEPARLRAMAVSPELFALLGERPALGRTFLPEEATTGRDRVALLSHHLWRDRFGADPRIVGRPIVLDGEPFAVVGVMPPGFSFPPPMANPAGRLPADAEVFLPLVDDDANRDYHPLAVVGRLAPGATLAEAQGEVAALARRLEHEYPKTNTDEGMAVVPMHEQMVWNVRPALGVLLGAVSFVLLIACANVAHLLLARAASRRRELAVRAALGSSRWRVVQQVVSEGLLLAGMGGVLGVLLAQWAVDLLRTSEASGLPRLSEVAIDVRVLGFTAAVSIVTGLLFTLAPAVQVTRPDLDEVLRHAGRTSTAAFGPRLRAALVVGEVAMALVLLTGAGLLVRSLGRLLDVDPGFDPRNLLTMGVELPELRYRTDPERAAFFRELLARVERRRGVIACGLVNSLPIAGWQGPTLAYAEGRPVPAAVADTPLVGYRVVSPGFFGALGLTLRRGRLLSDGDGAEAPHVAVLNEAAVRLLFAQEDPVGRQVHLDKPDNPGWTIVGVTGDTRHEGLAAPVSAEVYLPLAQEVWSRMNLIVRTGVPPVSLAQAVREDVRALDRELPAPAFKTMEELIADSVAPRRFQATLLGGFALLAFGLAAIGLYGVVSYSVGQRTRELAIRISQGASPATIFRMVVGQGMALTATGIAVGLAGALALSRIIGGMLYGVSAVDPLTLLACSGALGAVALVANLLPAHRARRVDPVEALRAE